MRFAYADPPYLGCGALYAKHHADALDWDRPETHQALIERLCAEFADGWAMSLSSPSLRTILPMCPADVRVGAWLKPFAIYKPNVGLAYAWEPVLLRGGRKIGRDEPTVRDWVSAPAISANITLRRGLTGAKPREFCLWLFAALNANAEDEFVDLFPGTGAVMAAWREFTRRAEAEPFLLGLETIP